jgi:hypothetical protein
MVWLLIVFSILSGISQAQSIAEVARQERERQAQTTSARVFTSQDARLPAPAAAPVPPAAPAAAAGAAAAGSQTTPSSAPPAAAQPAPEATPAAIPAVPTPDPAKEWNDQLDKLRLRILELQNEETALQLRVNQLTNEIFAPVSDQASRDQAQAALGETQLRLTAVRTELEQTRKTLDDMNIQGPPKPLK